MFSDIISVNEKISGVKWWPRFAYHYTDMSNAVNILSTGKLYSRLNAQQMHLMKNDNASRQVIDMTNAVVASYVRFYFRPLTPTQYYNEGYKHSLLRYDHDENANVPVPVFFVFDLNKLLSDPNTLYSERSQAGTGSELCNTKEEFRAFCFERIYGTGIPSKEDVPYRHAEIVYPSQYDIDRSLIGVGCRNEVEKQSLCNLLMMQNKRAFTKYITKIKVVKDNMFENNGLFVTDCYYSDNSLGIEFSNTKNKRDYARYMASQDGSINLETLETDSHITFDWMGTEGILSHRQFSSNIAYYNTRGYTFSNIPKVSGANELQVRVYIEDKLMCFLKYQLDCCEVY